MAHSRHRTVAVGIVLGAALIGVPAHLSAIGAAAPAWVTTSGNIVHLTLIAGYNDVNSGFNFDGAAHGQMVVTVPLGARVEATFTNKAQGAFHNAVIIPYTMPLPAGSPRPAFPGAETPTPRFRPGAPGGGPRSGGNAPQTFSFTASKAGTYMIVCGISGHAIAGMWDRFVVSPATKVASVVFNKAAVASKVTTAPPPTNTSSLISTSGKVVHLTLIAGYNNANAGFNFDGAAHGQMVVTVPLGATVDVVFKDNVAVPHDVVIIPYQKPLPTHSVATAFPGSASPRPRFRPPTGGGTASGTPPARPKPGAALPFTFTAGKAGTYMIICGVPGHAIAGMWDTFVVSPTARAASIAFTL